MLAERWSGLMRPKTREAMEMLFRAKWNLPTAAKHADLTHKETKLAFAAWVDSHPTTYKNEIMTQLWLF